MSDEYTKYLETEIAKLDSELAKDYSECHEIIQALITILLGSQKATLKEVLERYRSLQNSQDEI